MSMKNTSLNLDSNRHTSASSFIILILVLLVVLLCLYLYASKTTAQQRWNTPAAQLSAEKASIIKTLVRQSARWSSAAGQDTSPLIATLHANYGEGYMSALQSIATDSEIHAATGIDVLQWQNKIAQIQDQATLNLAQQCPNFAKNIDLQLASIAAE
jgi:hypothetical protein